MKFRVTMKDPDAVLDAYGEAARSAVASIQGISEDEREELIEGRLEAISDDCKEWFLDDEYLEVEVDTEAGTCVVKSARRVR